MGRVEYANGFGQVRTGRPAHTVIREAKPAHFGKISNSVWRGPRLGDTFFLVLVDSPAACKGSAKKRKRT